MKFAATITTFILLTLVCFPDQNPAPKFSATASIDIIKRNVDAQGNAPSSLNSEMEHIVSRPVLDEVARRLNLAEKWTENEGAPSSDEIYSRIKNMLTVSPVVKISLIRITAKSDDSAEAVAVANETARAFADDIKEKNDKAVKTAQEEADRELKIQEKLVEQLTLKAQALRKKEGFSEYLFTDEQDNNTTAEKIRMKQLKNDRLSSEKEMRAAHERLKNLTELKDKSMDELAAEANDPFLSSLLKQIRQYEKQLSEIKPSLGPDHPEIKQVKAALDELNRHLKSGIEGILKGAQAQNIIAKSKIDALDEEISKSSLSLSAPPRVKSTELQQAQTEYEKQNAALTTLKEKSFMVQYARPDCSVRIWESAVASPSEFEMAYQAVRQDSIKELHHATSRISVQKQEEPIVGETPGVKPFSPLAIERSIIVSSPVLTNVIQQLNLAQKWAVNGISPSPKEACSLLRGKLTVRQIENTSVIEISATSPDATEAVAIANKVARAYKQYVDEQPLKEKQQAEEALANMLKKQEDMAQQAELKYRELRKQQGLPEQPVKVDKNAERLRLQQREVDRVQARVEMLVAKARLDQLTELKDEDLVTASAYYANDPSIQTLRSDIKSVAKKLKSMVADDPDAKQTQTALNELNIRMGTITKELKKTIEEDYTKKKATFDALDQERASLSGQDENPETRKARAKYEAQKGIFEALKKRVSEMPPPQEKPPRCTVEIISLADTASD